ncbi:VCBS repeat-containing protein [Streptomyces sp. NBC_00386]|uniref:FG-GAP repeat domain-containing protein n=1 Tax=Streptomyces sp. NBC_00386 TaxID=2975734 RepID=UPI002E20D191
MVLFGDANGDRRNDVLVRLSSGALRLYRPGCNAAVKPTTTYTTLATSGWTQYDVLTSPGDVSGDGRADLVSRDTSGNPYRNSGDGRGSFGSRTRIATGWGGYRSIS